MELVEFEIKTYQQAEEFIYSIPKFTTKNTPADTRQFYDFLGCPAENIDIVHVAGTNGKGSVCAYLSAIFIERGFRTATFTSPHLIVLRERFCVNDEMISENDFLRILHWLLSRIDEFNKKLNRIYYPTFFEFLFFMAMKYFEEKDARKIVLETGLGGRLDATNVIRKPKLCIITKIGMDHMEYLGDSLTQIAMEKAGIIKEEVPVIFCDFDRDVTNVIEQQAKKLHATAIAVNEGQIDKIKIHQKSIDFSFRSRYDYDVGVSLPTIALYQTMNSLLAIHAAEYFFCQEDMTTEDGVHQWQTFYQVVTFALAKTFWNGRMEEVYPHFYVDGAHNSDGISAFLSTLHAVGDENCILLFGVNQDKDYKKMIALLTKDAAYEEVITVTIKGQRAAKAEELQEIFRQYTSALVTACSSVDQAVRYCRRRQHKNRHVYAVGSLYLVGEIKKLACEGGNYD